MREVAAARGWWLRDGPRNDHVSVRLLILPCGRRAQVFYGEDDADPEVLVMAETTMTGTDTAEGTANDLLDGLVAVWDAIGDPNVV